MGFSTAAIGIISAVTSVASGVLGAVGAIQQGKAAAAAGEYQNNVAQLNKEISLENASRTELAAQEEGLQQDNQNRGALGEMTAEQSASGLSLGSGSFMKTRRAAKTLGRLDTLNVRQAGDVQAYGYRVDAVNQDVQGQMAKTAGKSALMASYLSAGSSLLSTAGSVFGGSSRFGSQKKSVATSSDPWFGLRSRA